MLRLKTRRLHVKIDNFMFGSFLDLTKKRFSQSNIRFFSSHCSTCSMPLILPNSFRMGPHYCGSPCPDCKQSRDKLAIEIESLALPCTYPENPDMLFVHKEIHYKHLRYPGRFVIIHRCRIKNSLHIITIVVRRKKNLSFFKKLFYYLFYTPGFRTTFYYRMEFVSLANFEK
jgi:hypothetical protein